ncbi:MAG: triphosphoribosyl-dephospho-CoA synthase [Planctomycetia bacterium]|nr:triphosphoribosyl-dephospho-CoA synthase [Planctomycetia bacterium]
MPPADPQNDRQLLEDQIRAACILEATARKAGNVHPLRSFSDLTYDDFVGSANVVAPILARTAESGVGLAVRDAVAATQKRVGRNTNLGIMLLLAPLAAMPHGVRLVDGIEAVLAGLTRRDAELVYEAIRLANPGGLGRVSEQDIAEQPTQSLRDVMALAADRDLIARQYVENFSLVLDFGLPYLARTTDFAQHWEPAIVGLQLEIMALHADSLIVRKCGREVADEASQRARAVLAAAQPGTRQAQESLIEFDLWLRADGNKRNPGTTADLIAASLFAAFRDGGIPTRVIPQPLGPLL